MLLLDRLQRKARNSSREVRTAHRARKRVEEDQGDGVGVEEADDVTATVAALGDDEDGGDVLG
jgi:flavin-dependent dehydrogenase